MRSIERRFNQLVLENPGLSSLLCFGRAIAGQKFSKDRTSRYFSTLVNPEDYEKEDKSDLLAHFYRLSQTPEAYQIRSIFPLRGFVFQKTINGSWTEV